MFGGIDSLAVAFKRKIKIDIEEYLLKLRYEEIERKLEELIKIIDEKSYKIDEALKGLIDKYGEYRDAIEELKSRDPKNLEKLREVIKDAKKAYETFDINVKKNRFKKVVEDLRMIYNEIRKLGENLDFVLAVKELIVMILKAFGLLQL